MIIPIIMRLPSWYHIIMAKPSLKLTGFEYIELFDPTGLARLDNAFFDYLKQEDQRLQDQLIAYRENRLTLSQIELSEFLIALAKKLEDFLINLFNIEEAAAIAQARTLSFNPIAAFKKYYVLRRAKKRIE